MNYLNSFLINGKTGAKVKMRAIKLGKVELALLKASLLCIVVSLRAESSSGLLKIVELYKGFF